MSSRINMPRGLTWLVVFIALVLAASHTVKVQSGQSWLQVTSIPATLHVQDILFVSANEIYLAARTGGVAHSTDRGATWQFVNSGLSGLDVQRLFRTPSGAILAGANGPPGSTGISSAFLLVNGTWAKSDLPAAATGFVLNRRNEILAYSGGFVYRSTDGLRYTRLAQVNTGLGQVLAISPAGDIYAGTEGNGVFKSADDGNTWQNIGPQSNGATFGFSIHGDVLFAEKATLWRYVGGTTWVTSEAGMPNSPRVISIVTNSLGRMFAGLFQNVWVSSDDGRSWTPYGTGFPSTFGGGTLELDPNGYLWVGGGEPWGGLYRTSLSTTGGGGPTPTAPTAPTNLRIIP